MDAYRRLAAWQRCHALTLSVYRVTADFPHGERFGITDQLRRAAVSTCANLAEGWARKGPKELARFAGIALSSLAELDALLLIRRDLKYLTEADYEALRSCYLEASKTTWGLLRSMRR
jgi:four helix bundle protein